MCGGGVESDQYYDNDIENLIGKPTWPMRPNWSLQITLPNCTFGDFKNDRSKKECKVEMKN